MEESLIMKDFDHPNVLNLIGVCVDGGPAPYLVVPFMANGSLLKYLKRERPKLMVAEGTDSDLVGYSGYMNKLKCYWNHIIIYRSRKFRRSYCRCVYKLQGEWNI